MRITLDDDDPRGSLEIGDLSERFESDFSYWSARQYDSSGAMHFGVCSTTNAPR